MSGRLMMLLPLLAGLFLCSPASEAKKTKDLEDLHYQVSVSRVVVEITALDNAGRFADGLTKEDFRITENGKSVDIVDFSLERLVPEENGTTASQGRQFVLFVDLMSSRPSAVELAQRLLLHFVDETMRPTDEMLVACLTRDKRTLILQEFTTSRLKLQNAIRLFAGNPATEGMERSWERDLRTLLYRDNDLSGIGQQVDNPIPLNDMMTGIRSATNVVNSISKLEYERAVHSMAALATVVESAHPAGESPNRKQVLYVTEGSPLRPAQAYYDLLNQRIKQYNALFDRSGESETRRSRLFSVRPQFDLGPVVENTAGRLGRAEATVYALDLRGAFQTTEKGSGGTEQTPGKVNVELAYDEAQSCSGQLAGQTGGLAYFHRTAFDQALAGIERDSRFRYVATYKPPEVKKKKKSRLRKIEVQCKRNDIDVRARSLVLN